jgi:hypothetical protein
VKEVSLRSLTVLVVVVIVVAVVSIAAELAAVITVTVAVMVVVNTTDINQPRCNTNRRLLSVGFFMSMLLKSCKLYFNRII